MVVNFYRQCQSNFEALQARILETPHSRSVHNDAWVMYSNSHLFSELDCAWAFWTLSVQSRNSIMSSSWTCSNSDTKISNKVRNKKAAFLIEMQERLDQVQIESRDALNVIDVRKELPDAFFYVDPPYFNSNMGHYGGYTVQDFENLLVKLTEIKGKFLLSSYPSDLLNEYSKRFKWYSRTFEMNISASGKGKRKVEVLTSNFPI